jgi:hypothetical protein
MASLATTAVQQTPRIFFAMVRVTAEWERERETHTHTHTHTHWYRSRQSVQLWQCGETSWHCDLSGESPKQAVLPHCKCRSRTEMCRITSMDIWEFDEASHARMLKCRWTMAPCRWSKLHRSRSTDSMWASMPTLWIYKSSLLLLPSHHSSNPSLLLARSTTLQVSGLTHRNTHRYTHTKTPREGILFVCHDFHTPVYETFLCCDGHTQKKEKKNGYWSNADGKLEQSRTKGENEIQCGCSGLSEQLSWWLGLLREREKPIWRRRRRRVPTW